MDRDGSSVADLVRRAADGDQAAWDGLVERFTPLVLSVAHRFRLARADVEDVVQTLWLRLVEHLADIREPQALPGWIVTTVRHECLRTLRLRRRSQPFDPLDVTTEREDPDMVPVDTEVVDGLTEASRHELLLRAFADLPSSHRDLLLLLMHDPPLSYVEIGRRLGIPVGSIGPTRARALRRLREHPAIAGVLGESPDVRATPSQ